MSGDPSAISDQQKMIQCAVQRTKEYADLLLAQ